MTGNAEVRELLEAIFVAELLVPSESIWVVSPWITDIEILDNRSGAYSALGPQWGPRKIRLSEIFGAILDRTHLIVVGRPDTHNEVFFQKLEDIASASGTIGNLTIIRREQLHLKGILGSHYYLSGSMNLTYNGVEINEEGVTFETTESETAAARIAFHENYEVDQ
jgi:hypothetical protein